MNSTSQKTQVESSPVNFSKMTDQELFAKTEDLARSERRITHLILQHILEIERRRVFAAQGFDSMFSYLTKSLGYSEAGAYRRLQAARLLRRIPCISDKLEQGSLNLTQLSRVQKYLRQENKSTADTLDLLTRIENKNTFETNQALAQAFKFPIQTEESIKPQQDCSVRLEIHLTSVQYQELLSAKSELSHSVPDGRWGSVIFALAKRFNRTKKLPEAKVADHIAKKPRSAHADSLSFSTRSHFDQPVEANSNVTQQLDLAAVNSLKVKNSSYRRPFISASLKRALLKKAHHCCEFVNPETGIVCQSTYQLQIDYLHPVALGGSHSPANLRILCRTHNLWMAMKWGLAVYRAKSLS